MWPTKRLSTGCSSGWQIHFCGQTGSQKSHLLHGLLAHWSPSTGKTQQNTTLKTSKSKINSKSLVEFLSLSFVCCWDFQVASLLGWPGCWPWLLFVVPWSCLQLPGWNPPLQPTDFTSAKPSSIAHSLTLSRACLVQVQVQFSALVQCFLVSEIDPC